MRRLGEVSHHLDHVMAGAEPELFECHFGDIVHVRPKPEPMIFGPMTWVALRLEWFSIVT